MSRIVFLIIINLFFIACLGAQPISFPQKITTAHPRLLIQPSQRTELLEKIRITNHYADLFERTKKQVDEYVKRHVSDSSWIVSRLQMYWNTKASEIYIKAGVFSHVAGKAPVPTVRFTGTRDAVTAYTVPRIEDIQPYMDDPRGLYLPNRTKEGNPFEWVEPAKAGRVVESINRSIMSLAQSAAFLYWLTGEEEYGKFAFDIFNTYMTGMFYRNEPVDLNHSHNQTLVGLSSFEVIHEDILNELTICYDFLHGFITSNQPEMLPIYAAVFQKWADLIIKNGVPFNNWNLIEAKFVAQIALVLENDSAYKNGKGFHYYMDRILNQSETRQWSFQKLMKYGFDPNTGIWNESPGYAMGVVHDFLGFVGIFDRVLDYDLLGQLPVLEKAVLALPQYLFPNGYTSSFGDAHYARLSTGSIELVLLNAQKYGKKEMEKKFTRLLKMVEKLNETADSLENKNVAGSSGVRKENFISMLSRMNLLADPAIGAGTLQEFTTPVFYAPNTSFIVQRNGLDPLSGLMVFTTGSKGNHAHANGISIELYGNGLVTGAEAGIGTSYFQPDYAEYYSQFPAHNTVVVDGKSSYPVMRSNHGFELASAWPAPSKQFSGYLPVTFTDVVFLEPETNADQRRLISIVRTGEKSGYYIDIFRSGKKKKNDKYHDYFYHNLGQKMELKTQSGDLLPIKPSDKLCFADGDLFAYDYLWDKKSIETVGGVRADFYLRIPGRPENRMTLWMKGEKNREFFSVKSPPSKAFNRGMVPDSITGLPMPTFVARQYGEAWTHPFISVFEPTSGNVGNDVIGVKEMNIKGDSRDFVGTIVQRKNQAQEYIFSSTSGSENITSGKIGFKGMYAVISEQGGKMQSVFLGNGTQISFGGYGLKSLKEKGSACFYQQNGSWFIIASYPFELSIPLSEMKGKNTVWIQNKKEISLMGKKGVLNGVEVLVFTVPGTQEAKIFW